MTPFRLLTECPSCGKLHVDRGEWATKPHKTHLCVDDPHSAPEKGCGTRWRPSEYPTVGVATLQDTVYLDDEAAPGELRAALPEYLRDETDLVFAVKVLAGHYAGAQTTNASFGAHIAACEAALKAYMGGHTEAEIEAEAAKESNGSSFALAVRALRWSEQ
jgi:hypothetical protein